MNFKLLSILVSFLSAGSYAIITLCVGQSVPPEQKNPIFRSHDSPLILTASASSTAFMVPIYNKVYVADWIKLFGAPSKGIDYGQTITLADQGVFTAKDTRLVVTHEPVVKKLAGDAWEVTFK